MALQVTDLVDLIRLVQQHPEWRAALRQEILGEELISLPELVRQNTVAIDELRVQVAELRAAVEKLVESTSRHDRWIERADRDFARLKGDTLETRLRLNPHGLFGGRLRKMRVVHADDLDLLTQAEDEGSITAQDFRSVELLDLILAGREGKGADARDVVLAVEIAFVIRPDDIERARSRADVLHRVGYNAVPGVAGHELGNRAREVASSRGVDIFLIETDTSANDAA
jgi:hypothetical protein